MTLRARRGRVMWAGGDPSLTLHQNFLLNSGSTMALAALIGPTLTFTRASAGTNFNENGILVTASTNEPRFHHDPVTGAALGLLPEEQRENVFTHSSAFNENNWQKARVTVTPNAATAPDGTTTADRITEASDTATDHRLLQIITPDGSSEYTLSVSNKAEERSQIELTIQTDGFDDETNAISDADDCTLVSSDGDETATTVQDTGDGWCRFSITNLSDVALGTGFIIRLASGGTSVYNGDGTSGSLLWGGQLEAGAFPTSHIPTASAAVTRSADVNSANISSQLGATNTLFVPARTGFGPGVVVQIDDGTENERYRIERLANDEIHVIATVGGVEKANLNLGAVADQTDFKVAVSLASGADAMFASLNGAALVKGSPDSLPSVDTIRYGMDTVGNHWNNTIEGGKLWNVAKGEDFVQSIAA